MRGLKKHFLANEGGAASYSEAAPKDQRAIAAGSTFKPSQSSTVVSTHEVEKMVEAKVAELIEARAWKEYGLPTLE